MSGAVADEVLSGIDRLAPLLESGARRALESGSLPDETFEAARAAGLFRLYSPAEVGGLGCDLLDGVEVVERLAALDTSTAWIAGVGLLHAGFAGAYLADHAAQELFADGNPVIAGQMAPRGRARRVDGGLVGSGSWSFGSGIRHADWVLGGASLDDGESAHTPVVVVAPRSKAVVDEDSWQVAGLAGTGSCDYRLDDVHVPDGWWFGFPMAPRCRGSRIFDLPVPIQTIILHGGFVLGTARRSLDEITALAAGRTRANTDVPLGADPVFQRELAEHRATAAAARLYVLDATSRLQSATGDDRLAIGIESRAAARLATDVAVEVTTWAYRRGGTSAMRLDSPLQRLMRDTLGASQHLYADDVAYTGYGAHLTAGAG